MKIANKRNLNARFWLNARSSLSLAGVVASLVVSKSHGEVVAALLVAVEFRPPMGLQPQLAPERLRRRVFPAGAGVALLKRHACGEQGG